MIRFPSKRPLHWYIALISFTCLFPLKLYSNTKISSLLCFKFQWQQLQRFGTIPGKRVSSLPCNYTNGFTKTTLLTTSSEIFGKVLQCWDIKFSSGCSCMIELTQGTCSKEIISSSNPTIVRCAIPTRMKLLSIYSGTTPLLWTAGTPSFPLEEEAFLYSMKLFSQLRLFPPALLWTLLSWV